MACGLLAVKRYLPSGFHIPWTGRSSSAEIAGLARTSRILSDLIAFLIRRSLALLSDTSPWVELSCKQPLNTLCNLILTLATQPTFSVNPHHDLLREPFPAAFTRSPVSEFAGGPSYRQGGATSIRSRWSCSHLRIESGFSGTRLPEPERLSSRVANVETDSRQHEGVGVWNYSRLLPEGFPRAPVTAERTAIRK